MNIDFTKFAEQNMLTYNDDKTRVFVKPTDRHNFTAYPLEDLSGVVALTLEEYLGLRTNYYQFNEQLNGIEEYVAEEQNVEEIPDETTFDGDTEK
nr:MAG TPA: hypothetical protein [Caudoviricetes sp.]